MSLQKLSQVRTSYWNIFIFWYAINSKVSIIRRVAVVTGQKSTLIKLMSLSTALKTSKKPFYRSLWVITGLLVTVESYRKKASKKVFWQCFWTISRPQIRIKLETQDVPSYIYILRHVHCSTWPLVNRMKEQLFFFFLFKFFNLFSSFFFCSVVII